MKIAYLMHYMKNNFEEITENLDILINQGDDVYLMVNDDDLRDDMKKKTVPLLMIVSS